MRGLKARPAWRGGRAEPGSRGFGYVVASSLDVDANHSPLDPPSAWSTQCAKHGPRWSWLALSLGSPSGPPCLCIYTRSYARELTLATIISRTTAPAATPRTMVLPTAASSGRSKRTVRLTQKLRDENNAAVPELAAHIPPSASNIGSDIIEQALPVPLPSEPSSTSVDTDLLPQPVESQSGEPFTFYSPMRHI